MGAVPVFMQAVWSNRIGSGDKASKLLTGDACQTQGSRARASGRKAAAALASARQMPVLPERREAVVEAMDCAMSYHLPPERRCLPGRWAGREMSSTLIGR